MRVDMAERLSAVIRAAAREGKFQITEEMLSLAGATRPQMEKILEDLGYRKVEEIPSEDPEKPATGVFERPARPKKGKHDKRAADASTPSGEGARSRRKNKSGKSGKPQGSARKAEIPSFNPDSPFAVLARLKEGNS